MKVNARCTVCDRDFPIDAVLAGGAGGRCPFCGTSLDADYAGSAVKALIALQRAGSDLESALEQVRTLASNIQIEPSSVLDPIRDALAPGAATVTRE